MDYFEKYSSNCSAGMGNQHIFITQNPEEEITSRVFFRVTFRGKDEYSFLFSNIIDSTFYNGQQSRCNMITDEWYIVSLKAAVCRSCKSREMIDSSDFVSDFTTVTFNGKQSKTAAPAEYFATDPVIIDTTGGQYICLEMTFRGTRIPYHEETLLPMFVKTDDGWVFSPKTPVAGMVGRRKEVRKRIGIMGDSITQGIGTPPNSYEHYAAVAANNLGEDYAVWDIGLGFGRGYDAATNGAWMFKALQNDIVTVCYGVNDINQGYTADEIKQSISKIVTVLKDAGKTVILHTVPPFDYDRKNRKTWEEVNSFIMTEMTGIADAVLDVRQFLSVSKRRPHMTKYGCHPNSDGNAVWGEELTKLLKKLL